MAIESLTKVKARPKLEPKTGFDVDYYYDSHPTEEDLMGSSIPQSKLIHYLLNVLEWRYRQEQWLIADDLGMYLTGKRKEAPLEPDVALFKGVVLTQSQRTSLRSWKLWRTGQPAPAVVFEIASDSTWRNDLEQKPELYRQAGVREYFAYDPNEPGVYEGYNLRLMGWQYKTGQMQRIEADTRGWLRSEEMDCWLMADKEYVRLMDATGQPWLTGEEAERIAKETERANLAALMAKLRANHIDPDQL